MDKKEAVIRDDLVVEIDLAAFFWSILEKWRVILVFALLFALLLGGVKGFQSYQLLRDPEAQQAAMEKERFAQGDYLATKQRLLSLQEEYRSAISQLLDYGTHSALLAIDPYRVYVEEAVYYIDVDQSGFLESALQGKNYSAPLVNAYRLALSEIDVVSLLSELDRQPYSQEIWPLGTDEPEQAVSNSTSSQDSSALQSARSLRVPSFLTVSADAEASLLTVFAIGASEEQAHAIIQAAAGKIDAVKASFEEAIHPHSVTLLSGMREQIVSQELLLFRDDYQALLQHETDALKAVTEKLDDLQAPSPGTVTMQTVVKRTIKFAVVGFAVGAILSSLALGAWLVLTGRVLDADELWHRYRLASLGVCVPSKATALDRFIAQRRGLSGDEEHALALCTANLKAQCPEGSRILLTGSASKEKMDSLCRELSARLTALKLSAAGNILSEAESIDALSETDAVVLVEELGKVTHTDIEREIVKVQATGKTLPGVFLVGPARK